MRIVRFIQTDPESGGQIAPRWGRLTDQTIYPLDQAPYLDSSLVSSDGELLRLDQARLVEPVKPSKIICVGRNYAEHAAELGNEVPAEPLIFLKPPTVLVGPDEPVVYPSISERVDHEGELSLVIGRRCRNLTEDEAYSVIFGYTISNDVTARDLQKKDGQWTRGKGFDTFGPTGPWIDTDFTPAGRELIVTVNGEVRQAGNTDLMIYRIPRILSFVTRFMTLEAGDLIMTGTPAGVGPVHPGDMMTVSIEGLGSLSTPVISEEEARRR